MAQNQANFGISFNVNKSGLEQIKASLNSIKKMSNKDLLKAIDDISLKLPDKGLIFILGKSGSGKSTFLNMLGGLDSVTEGDIIVDDNPEILEQVTDNCQPVLIDMPYNKNCHNFVRYNSFIDFVNSLV